MSDDERDRKITDLEQRLQALETALRDGLLMVTRQVEKAQGMKK